MSAAPLAMDHEFMARALRLAELGLYSTSPNPRVGCVLVKGGGPLEIVINRVKRGSAE